VLAYRVLGELYRRTTAGQRVEMGIEMSRALTRAAKAAGRPQDLADLGRLREVRGER
jgi:hypothetical protein